MYSRGTGVVMISLCTFFPAQGPPVGFSQADSEQQDAAPDLLDGLPASGAGAEG